MSITGIDVSDYQGSSFSTSGLGFVIVKATEGRSYINPKQAAQAKRARDAGCVVGFYHFLWPGNIQAQAEYFVDKCASVEGDVLAVDWENTSAGTCASGAEKDAFIRAVKQLRPNHRVILYCNRDFWLNHDTTSYAGDGLWIADYNGHAGKPGIKASWLIHQYTSKPVDTNTAQFASTAAMKSWARKYLEVQPEKAKPKPPRFPGRDKFGPGKSNTYITQLGQQLVRKGFGKHYQQGPGPHWSDTDRKNVEDFQRAQGWTGANADGLPGPETWSRLFA